MFPVFRKERTVHSRCHVCCHHRSLDRESSTSAERIDKDPVFVPRSQHDQRGSQCLCDRRLDGHLTVSSFVQGNAGSVDPNCCHILHKSDTNRETCSIFREPGDPIDALESFYDRLFHDRLDIRRAEQSTFYGVCLCHPEFTILRDIFFPRDRLGLLKQFVKSHCLELSCLEKDTLCGAEEHVCLCDALCICQKSNFSVFYFADLISQIQDLTFQNRFHTKMARCDQFHIFHPSLISLMIFPSKSLIVNTLSSRTAYVGGFPSFGIDTDPGFRRIYPSLCSALSTCVCPWIRISPS